MYVTDCNGPAIMSHELNKRRSGDKCVSGSSKTVFEGADKGFRQFKTINWPIFFFQKPLCDSS